MKLYKSITAAALLAFGIASTGCSDWLDYTQKDKQTYDEQFNNRTGFHTTVNGIYNTMTGSDLYGYNLSYGPIDIMGLCYKISNSSTAKYELCTAAYTSTYASSTINSIWSTAYNTILNINVVLKALDEKPGVLLPEDAQMIRGEMLASRAFIHLDLVRIFGPVYIVNPDGLSVPYADAPEIIKRNRLKVDDIIYNKIIPDLTAAQELLKNVDPILTEGVLNSDGGEDGNWFRYRQLRMNYYAATLVKARAYLWVNDYTNALAEARKITDDTYAQSCFPWVDPVKLLANNSNPDRIFSTECLFGFYDNKMAEIFTNNFNGTLDAAVVLKPRDGYTDILFPNSADYRRQSQWTGTTSISGGDLDFIKYKSFPTSETNPDFWATYYGLMRKSEAYYIAAEALNGLDDLRGACGYLNQVKAARGIDLIETDSPADFLKELKMEYLREMRGEGQIFFLHKHFNQSFATSNSDFNAHEAANKDNPTISQRYNVPIPSGENY